MPRYTTDSGRRRSDRERLYTEALMAELDLERERLAMDQRTFALHLNVHESLLSLYRTGNRLPSIPSLLEMEEKIPGIDIRVHHRYHRLKEQMSSSGGDPSQGRQLAADLGRIGNEELARLFP